MGETIAVLFIFFVLLSFGFIFYLNVIKSSFDIKEDEKLQLFSNQIVKRISYFPELQYSEENVIKEGVDAFKIESARELINANSADYYDEFGFSNITIQSLYPKKTEIMLYNNSPPEYDDMLVTYVPVPIFNPISKTKSFGVLTIKVFKE